MGHCGRYWCGDDEDCACECAGCTDAMLVVLDDVAVSIDYQIQAMKERA